MASGSKTAAAIALAGNLWCIFMVGLLGNFVADHTANRCTSTRAGQSAAQHIAHHTTQNSAGGSALFLLGHAGATAQTHGRTFRRVKS